MANGINYTKVGGYFLIAAVASLIFVDCREIGTVQTKESLKHNKAVIKTIKGDGGHVIDCVDIYKQPALNHPLLINHTIELKPSSYPNGIEAISLEDELFQYWRQNGECPEGTIPIVRTQGVDHHRSKPRFNPKEIGSTPSTGHEYAQVGMYDGGYYGAQARLNVWNPASFNGEISITQTWIVGGQGQELSTLEAGWLVRSPDSQTRLFIFWTGDNYQGGCYNHDCPGFVQINSKVAIGYPITPISIYNGTQYDIFLSIYKNTVSGHWWLQVGNEAVGYWPDTIVPGLRGSAEIISWGGEIFNSKPEGHHTSTQMGSHHFPIEGFGRASYVRNIQYLDNSSQFKDAEHLRTYATNPKCYDVLVKDKTSNFGTHMYYGGPGYSILCP
ncbi:hypothetical protein ACFX2J_046273 [Malus domestica]